MPVGVPKMARPSIDPVSAPSGDGAEGQVDS